VLSLSLGSLSSHSCELLCAQAVERGIDLARCQAYLQTQRQVCMYVDDEQVARINVALQILGVRGVSVFGSSGDGGSHWSFQPFPSTVRCTIILCEYDVCRHGLLLLGWPSVMEACAQDPVGKVLNEVGCAYSLPIFPSPSPYMVSVGGTQWRNQDPAQPEMWVVGNSGSGGGQSGRRLAAASLCHHFWMML
jgi:hypothetical protein